MTFREQNATIVSNYPGNLMLDLMEALDAFNMTRGMRVVAHFYADGSINLHNQPDGNRDPNDDGYLASPRNAVEAIEWLRRHTKV